MKKIFILLVGIGICFLGFHVHALDYSYTNLDIPGKAVDMNDNDVIVGSYSLADGTDKGFFYQGSSWSSFDPPPLIYPPDEWPWNDFEVMAINNQDVIIGNYRDGGSYFQFVYQHGSYVDNGPIIGGFDPEFHAINDEGIIAGYSNDQGGEGFTYDYLTGTFTILHPPPPPTWYYFHPYLINNQGILVGRYVEGINRPAIYDGEYKDLWYPGSIETIPYAINNLNWIVGSYINANGKSRGFSNNGTYYGSGNYPGANETWSVDTNDENMIVGYYTDLSGKTHGYALFNGAWTSIDYPGASETKALLVNNQGIIVGSYVKDGQEGQFIARPAPLPTVTIVATNPTASEVGPISGTMTVYRTGSTASPLTVYYKGGGTATAGVDRAYLPGNITIPAGASSAAITITPFIDSIVEGDETVVLTLSANSAYVIGSPSSATVTITDSSTVTKPTVTIVATDPTATEAGPTTGTMTVYRTGSTTSPLTVYYTGGGTATAGTDRAYLPGNVTIPSGATSAPITITPINDSIAESNETVILTLKANTAYTIGSPANATVTITDNDGTITKPVITMTATDPTATEAGPTTGTITVYRTGSTANSLTVYYTGGGTATAGVDRSYLPGSVTIPSGASSASITITPINDTIREGSETVVLTLKANTAYTIGSPSSATVTITDND